MDTSIMPLHETREEIFHTSHVLAHLLENNLAINKLALILKQKSIEQFIFIGSGDSYAVAQFISMGYEECLGLHTKAMQSYEFITLQEPVVKPDKTAIFIITASGRPSPIIDALIKSKKSGAFVISVTNHEQQQLRELSDFILCTKAKKQGMPTQSTTATLFILLNLMNILKQKNAEEFSINWHAVIKELPNIFAIVKEYNLNIDLTTRLTQPIIFLASGINRYIADIGCNLLACGPQLLSHVFLIEEYHHSLRLLHNNQSRNFILLLDEPIKENLFLSTAKQLVSQGAEVTILSAFQLSHKTKIPGVNILYFPYCNPDEFSFYCLIFFQCQALELAEYYTQQGGVRARKQGEANEKV